jgi:hypothetical protein
MSRRRCRILSLRGSKGTEGATTVPETIKEQRQ